jgi:phosphohistidine phosphatase
MDCILLRHGIAQDREAWNGPESERPLTKDGVQKTRKAVAGLKSLGIRPTHLLSSPFIRALETAKIVAETFNPDTAIQVCEELLFHRSPTDLFPVLAKLPKDSCVICVGHEPHLGETAAYMIFGKTADSLSLKKAGACGVEFDGKPQAGKGMLKWWLTSGQLRQLRQG